MLSLWHQSWLPVVHCSIECNRVLVGHLCCNICLAVLTWSGCAGHSLGGALAVLAEFDIASELRQANVSRVHAACYTFGAPRVGNPAFAKQYDQLVHDSWSIVNDQAGLLLCIVPWRNQSMLAHQCGIYVAQCVFSKSSKLLTHVLCQSMLLS